ncbi:hypothetical protein ONS95_010483 [Cadophora gregata]|uniref:uncharacterized protein n=1 Tax=Cadophora gregata TaxID=51156 RepID=UPI0026DB859F|nr:uncharacterized protein ONS95_010483 [Cadophora gregata]KAK0122230.1 hypothetical protein ONS95_010483 [Cadophora gregata]KAK0127706.1 hypothetical protein ONS96_007224 [Cadophora gregata f. sp. sojae]
MEHKLSPEQAQSVFETVTHLLSNKTELGRATMAVEDYPTILIAGSTSDDALPDLTILHKVELDWCYRHRWETKKSIDRSTIKGREQWSWIMDSFCSMYSGADLNVNRIFTMFQIHMAFTDRNENDSKMIFKFGVLDAYCELTTKNKGLSKKKQDWTLDLEALQCWVACETRNLDAKPLSTAAEIVKKVMENLHDDKQPKEACRESRQNISRNSRKRQREEAQGDLKDERDLEEKEDSGAARKKRKVKAPSTRKSAREVAEPKPKIGTRSKRAKTSRK